MPDIKDPPVAVLRQLELVVRHSPDFIGVADMAGHPVFTNAAALRLTGFEWDGMLRTPAWDFFVPAEREFVRNTVFPAALENGRWTGELTLRHGKTGAEIPVLCDIFRVDDPVTGQPVNFTAVIRDLTGEKQRETELQDARQRMESVLAATEVGTWTYEIAANRVSADANLTRLFGVSPEEADGGQLEAYLRAIHPEDRPEVEAVISAAIQSGTKYIAEYRLIQKDRSVKTVIARGTVERDADGKALRLPGVVLDITGRVRAENERREISDKLARQERMMEMALSSIADFAYVMDPAGRFVYANKALLDLWNLELKDVIGKNFHDLHYPEETAARLQRQIRQVCETGESLSDKTAYTSPTGVSGFYEYIFKPVPGAGGSVEFVAGSTRDITGRQSIFEALQRSEENFRTLAETMPQIVWAAGPDGVLDYYNRRWFDYIGLKPGAAAEVRWDLHLHAEDLPQAYERWAAAVASGGPYGIEFRVKRADSQYRWFLVRALPVRDEKGAITRWFGTCTDIHDQRELQAKLERSEALFRQLADTIPQLAWMARPDGHIFWYNNRWYEYTGITPGQMDGWAWQSVHDPEVLPQVLAGWNASLLSGEPFDMTFPIKGADGIFRPFLTRVMPFRDESGRTVLWFGTNTDVSEQRRIVQERDELLASERAARSTAEHASRMKDEFLATLSHELRSPLNAIFGWTQMLKESSDDPEDLTDGLNVIDRNVRALTRLIEDLLDMSRIISGKLRMDVQLVDPGKCIEAAMETVLTAADAKGIRIEKILDPRAGPVSGDPGRIQQIVWNLLSNAIKFTPRGGKVRVLLERVSSHLEISAEDSGEGISAEFLPHVFDRFRQADAAMNRRHGGLGLGLAIVKQLVELHGGTIQVRSGGMGKGSTFTVRLPLKTAHPHADDRERLHPRASDAPPAFRKNADLQGLEILVVDDERDARELLKRMLEDCKARVRAAASAAEALLLIAAEHPDIIVSDIGMPGVDGYEFLKALRAMRPEQGGGIPAVALTAFARPEDRARALLAGFSAHVSKPVEPSELIAAITAVAGPPGQGPRVKSL